MEQGLIFNIQRYSIHDGPGIRTTVFFKSCPLRCFWCQNPESQEGKPEIFLDLSKCTGCRKCLEVCPSGATAMRGEKPGINRSLCLGCGKCAEVCPNRARRLLGTYFTVEEVMRQVLKDQKFYENSGGGVTLSGGEATAQPQFALEILSRCKEAGLHTTLDTCGFVSWSTLEKLLPLLDLVLFDIKHMDPAKHKEGTGQDNRLILENAQKVARAKKMIVRVPLIPGFNDSVEDVRAIARFVREKLGPFKMEILPYNKLGEGKFAFLEKVCAPLQTQEDSYVQRLESTVESELNPG